MHRSSFLRCSGKVQHLVDSIFECDQIPRNEFITCAGKFVVVTDLKQFLQTFIGIKAHTISIRHSDKYQVEELFQSGQFLIETQPKKTMINPTERTADGSDSVRHRWLSSPVLHMLKLKQLCGIINISGLNPIEFIAGGGGAPTNVSPSPELVQELGDMHGNRSAAAATADCVGILRITQGDRRSMKKNFLLMTLAPPIASTFCFLRSFCRTLYLRL